MKDGETLAAAVRRGPRIDGGRLLQGPDGGNPLGFLCAVGTLRTATLAWPELRICMAWRRCGAGWRPVLSIDPELSEAEFVDGLFGYCRYGKSAGEPHEDLSPEEAFPYFAFDSNTSKISPHVLRRLARKAVEDADRQQGLTPKCRVFTDFLAAFGCEACVDGGVVEDTALRTMSGSGHQHFLKTMINLVAALSPEHIRSALLEPWRYEDPLANHSMRWDPQDLKRYALQWGNPSNDPTRAKRGSVLGANRLAVEALPLLPTAPVRGSVGPLRLATTGFEVSSSEPHWTWPIWEDPIPLDVCASLLAHQALPNLRRQEPGVEGDIARLDSRTGFEAMGVVEVFRSRRISVDYYRNFTPARAV